ncbi:flagellar biosynthetic protein FliO [Bacillus subtilis]|uniref:flagellar biosynthetic protein FliO n=1 Tax=Pseudochrobactrum asaccharolyticum TaxID=354351 RepID=UPI001F0122EA|nr:flagellar biosynthetic protein FliO [Pseudochrobactrum asaccharolyticum]MCF7644946.1 flagellar biosynthetic protein FliO [Pseudochrobactrum asaccharolyticum]MCF7671626.1 flagellar biosynthetic protein FliO [Bacillus subtilis]
MMDWLSGLLGENAAHIISFIGLFALFLAGVFVVFAVIKRMTAGTYVTKQHDAAPRLTVTDAAAVDSQRRLVLVRRDDVEHLILIGGPSDIVIEQNITRHKNKQQEQTAPRVRQQEERTGFAPVAAIAPVAAQAPLIAPEPNLSIAPAADIIAATPAYKPEAETPAPQPRAAAPTASAPVTVTASQAQTLQTHAQQVAAARQQQSQKPVQRQSAQPAARPVTEGAAPKLHPVYPLGQVSRGVIAATSGLAAANNAAQQELIEAAKRDNRSASPSLDDVRPGSAQKTEGNPLVSQRATPQVGRPTQQEPSFSAPVTPAPAPAKPAPQPSFELDLENAVAEALSSKDTAPDSEISFEDLLASEMDQHFAASEKAAAEKPASSTLDISPRK